MPLPLPRAAPTSHTTAAQLSFNSQFAAWPPLAQLPAQWCASRRWRVGLPRRPALRPLLSPPMVRTNVVRGRGERPVVLSPQPGPKDNMQACLPRAGQLWARHTGWGPAAVQAQRQQQRTCRRLTAAAAATLEGEAAVCHWHILEAACHGL